MATAMEEDGEAGAAADRLPLEAIERILFFVAQDGDPTLVCAAGLKPLIP
jgi:hypothetical protein